MFKVQLPRIKCLVIISCLIKGESQQARYFLGRVVKMWLADHALMTISAKADTYKIRISHQVIAYELCWSPMTG